jgi:hypothetical protein
MSRGDWSPAGSASRDLCCSRNHGSVVVETLWDQMESWQRTFPVTSRPLRVAHSGHPGVRWISGLSFSQKPTGVPVPTHRQRQLRIIRSSTRVTRTQKGLSMVPTEPGTRRDPIWGRSIRTTQILYTTTKAHQAALTAVVMCGGGDLHGMPRLASTLHQREMR